MIARSVSTAARSAVPLGIGSGSPLRRAPPRGEGGSNPVRILHGPRVIGGDFASRPPRLFAILTANAVTSRSRRCRLRGRHRSDRSGPARSGCRPAQMRISVDRQRGARLSRASPRGAPRRGTMSLVCELDARTFVVRNGPGGNRWSMPADARPRSRPELSAGRPPLGRTIVFAHPAILPSRRGRGAPGATLALRRTPPPSIVNSRRRGGFNIRPGDSGGGNPSTRSERSACPVPYAAAILGCICRARSRSGRSHFILSTVTAQRVCSVRAGPTPCTRTPTTPRTP